MSLLWLFRTDGARKSAVYKYQFSIYSKRMPYDLSDRTTKFSIAVIKLCRNLKEDTISRPLISQLVRSSTSIGANYREANNAISKADFRNKIFICKKEAQETGYWLEMLASCFVNQIGEINPLKRECRELIMIFQKITNSLRY
jgi:four helix bundle protein